MLKNKEDLDLIGNLTGFISSSLKQMDQGWEGRPNDQNRAYKLDPRKILSEHMDNAQMLVNKDTVNAEGVPNPNTVVPPQTQQVGRVYPAQPAPGPVRDPNQLELALPGVTVPKLDFGQLKDFVKHFDDRMDKLEHELNIMKAMLKEIKENTTKRKYKTKNIPPKPTPPSNRTFKEHEC